MAGRSRARLAGRRQGHAYADRVEILWWLAPPVVATVLAMLWVSWLGRSGRGEVDREVAVRRLGEAMARPTRVSSRTPPASDRPRERSTGVAVRRPSQRLTPSETDLSRHAAARPEAATTAEDPRQSTRRAS
jgi:hypothetical protein